MQHLNIAAIVQEMAIIVPGFLLAITVHEFTHGYVAYRLGDSTAKLAGRLTFNPLSHLDLIGTVALILMKIGWAKPVPVDPRNLRNPKTDMLWISLGGPAANLLAAVLLAFIIHVLVFMFEGKPVGQFGTFILRPLFPILLGAVQMNVLLAVFNLIPVPPLDGFAILTGILPLKQAYRLEQLQQYGFIILILLLVSGAVGYIIVPPINFIQRILLAGLG